jgi:alpha-ketoglutarate-dependent taurine dioxygenase
MVEKIHVRRGDIVVMDNQRVLHRRAAFTPRWDGTDRYFIRMSAARDPHAGLAADPARPWVWS